MGYCKNKENCIYLHNTEECETNCIEEKCLKRHRKNCKNGKYCFYNSTNTCEFNHTFYDNVDNVNNQNIKLKKENDDKNK